MERAAPSLRGRVRLCNARPWQEAYRREQRPSAVRMTSVLYLCLYHLLRACQGTCQADYPRSEMSVSVQVGLLLAVATALTSIVGFLYKHRGSVDGAAGRVHAPDLELDRAVQLALVRARDRRRDGLVGPARRRARARADLARPVDDRRLPRAAHGRRRPRVRPLGHPARVDRRRAHGARAGLPRRDAVGHRRTRRTATTRPATLARLRRPGHRRRPGRSSRWRARPRAPARCSPSRPA